MHAHLYVRHILAYMLTYIGERENFYTATYGEYFWKEAEKIGNCGCFHNRTRSHSNMGIKKAYFLHYILLFLGNFVSYVYNLY